MQKICSNIIFFLFILLNASAQDPDLFIAVDSASYAQYLKQDWKTLKKTVRFALNNDLDYYYLRMRAGIAFYETGNYRIAEKHFNKAIKFNSIDKIIHEYIFYSLLFSGRESDANLYFNNHEGYLLGKTHYDNTALEEISFDILYNFNLDSSPEKAMNYTEIDSLKGNQELSKYYYLGNFYFNHSLSKNLNLIHGGSFLRKYSFYYSSDDNAVYKYYNSFYQSQYYGSLSCNPGGGFLINAGGHFLYSFRPRVLYKTTGMGGSNSTIPAYRKSSGLVTLSIYKNLWLFNAGAGVTYSNLNYNEQFQKNFSLEFYPLGNLNLYSASKFYDIKESQSRYVFSQKVGGKISKSIWSEASFAWGDIKNMSMNDGFIVYNGNETITQKIDLNLFFVIKNITLSIRSSYQSRNNTFSDEYGWDTGLNKISSGNITILTGIKWKL